MKPIETGVLDDAVADYMASWTQMFSVRPQAFHIPVRGWTQSRRPFFAFLHFQTNRIPVVNKLVSRIRCDIGGNSPNVETAKS